MRTAVHCEMTICLNNKNAMCMLDSIDLSIDWEFQCDQYNSLFDLPEYQSEYWEYWRNKKTGKEFKQKEKGKRIEFEDLVFYTKQDYREGEASLTEEKSGYCCCKIGWLKQPDKMLEIRNALKDFFKTHPPVLELPTLDELEGGRE